SGAPGRVRVSARHVPRALLVAHEDVADRTVDERVVHGQDRTARKAEHDLGGFHLQALDERLSPCELHLVLRLGRSTGKENPLRRRRGEGARNAWKPCAYVITTRRVAGERNIRPQASTDSVLVHRAGVCGAAGDRAAQELGAIARTVAAADSFV